MIKDFIAFRSIRKTIKKCSNAMLNRMYVYYLHNQAKTIIQIYELSLLKEEINKRAKNGNTNHKN